MVGEHDGDYYEIIIPDLVRSRSTGEQIPLAEAVPFDRMPLILGVQFMADDGLRADVHFHGDHHGPFLAAEEAYTVLAEEAIGRGWIYVALDNYRRALHHAMQWSKGLATWQNGGLLTLGEVERFDPSPRFADLEARLATAVWQGVSTTTIFDSNAYSAFVRKVRESEKRAMQLGQLFHFGESNWYEPLTAPGVHDPDIGREYIDLSVAMGRFSRAAYVARKLGLVEEAIGYEVQAEREPRDNPRVRALIEEWEMRREIGSW